MRNAAIASAIALLALVGCEEESNQPTDAEFQQERAALNARVKARKAERASGRVSPARPAPSSPEIAAVPKGALVEEDLAMPKRASVEEDLAVPKGASVEEDLVGSSGGIVYASAGVRDPFRSFMWKRREIAGRIPIGAPLEQFDVSQLSVIAVVWKTGSARALVEDPAGQSYIIAKGTRIGKNAGLVTLIDDNLVIVNETYEDYLGNVTKKDIEMRIRRSEGG